MSLLLSLFSLSLISCWFNAESAIFDYYQLVDTEVLKEINLRQPEDNSVALTPRVFAFTTQQTEFLLCLWNKTKPITNDFSRQHSISDIQLLEGHVCGKKHSSVIGAITNGRFNGFVSEGSNLTYYVENIGRYPELRTKCPHCHSVLYTTRRQSFSRLSYDGTSPTFRPPHRAHNHVSTREDSHEGSLIYCDLMLIFHESYMTLCNSLTQCLSVIMLHISKLNEILAIQLKNPRGSPMLQYQISRTMVLGGEKARHYDIQRPENLLMQIGALSYSYDTCSTAMYLNVEWSGSILGMGNQAEPHRHNFCDIKNAYVVTARSEGENVAADVHLVTTLHEIGHNLGSLHDPAPDCGPSCYPMSEAARCTLKWPNTYIMSRKASQTTNFKNYRYSPCSIDSMRSLLLKSGSSDCLKAKTSAICGNGVIEEGEECDSGGADDICCGAPYSPTPCMLVRGECSPSQGKCCNANCMLKSSHERCMKEGECSYSQNCSGRSYKCPVPTPKEDGLLCGGASALCLSGMCVGSLCSLYNMSQCREPTYSCSVYCYFPKTRACLPIDTFNSSLNPYYPRGYDCQSEGVCDGQGGCIVPNTLLQNLRRILERFLSSSTFRIKVVCGALIIVEILFFLGLYYLL